MFDRNYGDLKLAIDEFSKAERIPLLFDQSESQIILYHMVRLLHNYLAAAKMLVDHTRTLINDWYRDTQFIDEYKHQVNVRFSNNTLSGFIEDLRNYALHYSLPVTGFRLEVRNDPKTRQQTGRVTFFIEKKTLLQWSNWSKGKQFMRVAGVEIAIEQLVEDYYRQIVNFHAWIHHSLEEIHADDLEWLRDMDQRLKRLLKRQDSRQDLAK